MRRAVVANHTALLEAEAKRLAFAAHWADLHNGDALDRDGKVLPGMEQGAEARRRAAEAEQFVSAGRCNEHGLKTLIAKAQSGTASSSPWWTVSPPPWRPSATPPP